MAPKVEQAKIVIQEGKKVVNAFVHNRRGMCGLDEELTHVINGTKAYIRGPQAHVNYGTLVQDGKVVKRISREEFEAMKQVKLVKEGNGNYTRVIDEFTGDRYEITPFGKVRNNEASYGSINEGLWNKILALFS